MATDTPQRKDKKDYAKPDIVEEETLERNVLITCGKVNPMAPTCSGGNREGS